MMKILGIGWKEGDPMPLSGWVLFGVLHGMAALTVGAFFSLCSYFYSGVFYGLLGALHEGWTPYYKEVAWTFGFCAGALGYCLKNRVVTRSNTNPGTRDKDNAEDAQRSRSQPRLTLADVVKRTIIGGGVGLFLGLLLALWLELLFASASLCPVGPTAWREAMKTERYSRREAITRKRESGMSLKSSHPLFKQLFLVPVSVMPVVGASVGGGVATRRWLAA